MRQEIKALSKETLIYGTSTVIGRFLNFLLVPFYVNVLRSTAEYGISTSLYTYLGFLNVIYPLGLEAAFFRYGARGEGMAPDLAQEKKVFSSSFLVILFFSIFLSLAIFFSAPFLAWPVFHDPLSDITALIPMLTFILRLGAGILFFDALSVLPFAALRLEHQAWRFASLRLTGIVITLILNFVFIVLFHWGVRGIFIANLISSATVFLLLLPMVVQRFVPRLDRETLRKLVPFGLTNVPAYLSSMMVQVIDRPIVQAYLGLSVLGIYQANYRMGFIMMVFVGLFEYAWRPFFMRQALKDDVQARRLFARVFTYFMVLALVGFLALAWGLPYLVSTPVHGHRLLRFDYLAGLPIIPVVLLAYVFQGMYTNFIAGIYIKEKNKSLPFITTLGAAVNILVNIWLIPRMGIMGAALATLFAYMAMASAIYIASQKAYPVPYEWSRVGLVAAIVVGAYVTEHILMAMDIVHGEPFLFLMRAALLLITIAALFLFGFFTDSEKKILRQIFTREKGTA